MFAFVQKSQFIHAKKLILYFVMLARGKRYECSIQLLCVLSVTAFFLLCGADFPFRILILMQFFFMLIVISRC